VSRAPSWATFALKVGLGRLDHRRFDELQLAQLGLQLSDARLAAVDLDAGVWFRRGRLLIVSPDSLDTACPPRAKRSLRMSSAA
jgi:hypothetical protein